MISEPDGNIHAVDFSSDDHFCLDGQRLFAATALLQEILNPKDEDEQRTSTVDSHNGRLSV